MEEDILFQNDASLIAVGGDAVAGSLHLCEVALVKVDMAIDATTTYTALEAAKATYATYAPSVITWGPATRSDDGHIEYLGKGAQFRPTDSVTPNGIYGMYVRNAGHTETLFQCRFATPPMPMESVLDAIDITLRYRPDDNSLAAILS